MLKSKLRHLLIPFLPELKLWIPSLQVVLLRVPLDPFRSGVSPDVVARFPMVSHIFELCLLAQKSPPANHL